ncbi:MAG: hypothetical protein PUA73_01750 [Bacilli bacterium]|nr:hypothetical protein [Bacilli bacterium]
MNLFNTLEYCTDVIDGGIPDGIGNLVSLIVKAIQIVVPILLIIWGMLDFAKAIIGQNEDKIKEGQKLFIKRLIAAIVVFLVVTIVQLAITIAASINGEGNQASSAWGCAKQLISGK